MLQGEKPRAALGHLYSPGCSRKTERIISYDTGCELENGLVCHMARMVDILGAAMHVAGTSAQLCSPRHFAARQGDGEEA